MIPENDFVLRPFDEKDYEGFVSLKNLLYPDHPGSVANLRHNDKRVKGLLKEGKYKLSQVRVKKMLKEWP